MIYLDHAATSHPKPDAVAAAMLRQLQSGGSPGRSGHRLARAAEEVLWNARGSAAKLFEVADPARVVFTVNATMALNIAIKGLAKPGRRVLTTAFEHNSVVRPLRALQAEGVTHAVVAPAADAPIDLQRLEEELRRGDVGMVVVSHASNVTGAVLDLAPIRELTRQFGVALVVDAAQTAGHQRITLADADVIACAGHKGLQGPQGTGLLIVGEDVTIRPLLQGGTGGRSEGDQPRWLPYSLESGTANAVGIAGLGAALTDLVAEKDLTAGARTDLREQLVAGLEKIDGVRIWTWPSPLPRAGVVSVTLDGTSSTDAASLLEERHNVLVRAGLHCSPLAHRTLGTFPDGTIRFSLGHSTVAADVDAAVEAMTDLAATGAI
jgi:cysteine desulfurase / selenocysteine lyase